MDDVRSYLESKGVHVKGAGNQLHMACFYCGETQDKRGRLYVAANSDPPGLFHCKLCDETGALNKIRKHFGDKPLGMDDSTPYDTVTPRILRAAQDYYYMALADHEESYNYLRQDRGLDFQTIESHELGWADGQLNKHLDRMGFKLADMVKTGLVKASGQDFLSNCITIPYFVAGNVVQIRGKFIGGKYLTPSALVGNKTFLYNSDVTWEAEDHLLICEGELDALTAEQLGYAAVGVPGASTWQENWNGYLEKIQRIYIVFDADATGVKCAEKLVDKLDGRPKIVNLTFKDDKNNDLNDWVVKEGHTTEDFAELIRQSRGGLLVSVREAHEKWLEIEGNPDLQGLKFGITAIDQAIQPGLLPGQVMVTIAKTGAGKTISLLNFFHRMKREQPERNFLFFSLEQTRNEWFERARRIHRFYEPSTSEMDTVDFWEHNFMLVDKNQITHDDVEACYEQYKYEQGVYPDMCAIDYLGYFATGYRGKDTYERTSNAIKGIKGLAKDLECPFYIPHQVSRMNEPGEEPELSSARDSGVTEETADFLFALWAADQKKGLELNDRSGEVSMKILKSRHGGVNTKIDMLFTPKTLAMIPTNDPLHYKAQDEIRLIRVGDDLDTVVYRNLTGWDGAIMTDEIRADMERLKQEGVM